MYFPEEDDNTHYVIDTQYGLEGGDYFTEYEITLLRLVSMRLIYTPMALEVDDTEERLAYWRSEEEKEIAIKRKDLKRHLSEEDEEEAGPSKRRKLNDEKSEEEGEPGTSQGCYDSSFRGVDIKDDPEAEEKKTTKDI